MKIFKYLLPFISTFVIVMKLQKKEPKKKGPNKKILTEAEKEEKEALRKAKYEEFKAKKAEEKEKRRIRNEELRLKRKQKKVNLQHISQFDK